MDTPEVELARRLIAGDKEALQSFIETFQRKVFQYTWLMCGQREDAEEVAQDTLLKVFENWAQLRDPAQVKPWVFRIARNCCLTKRRKSAFAPSAEVPIDDVQLTAADEQPDELLARKEIRDDLDRALRSIPEHYRAVILLRDVEELSTAETASLLEISEQNAKQRLHRARAMLRIALAT
ncbi:MAG: sigma-70 family RNA polymerase sigma factor [Acidobacteria bacterium]|nr:sigma-70 family RNA polymerase sigma factor [Acidobacteriota bacterium]